MIPTGGHMGQFTLAMTLLMLLAFIFFAPSDVAQKKEARTTDYNALQSDNRGGSTWDYLDSDLNTIHLDDLISKDEQYPAISAGPNVTTIDPGNVMTVEGERDNLYLYQSRGPDYHIVWSPEEDAWLIYLITE